MKNNRTRLRGFSLIELVIVVVIIGIIAAIAIPRMSRGSAGASDNALAGDMAVWRSALDLYQSEHSNTYPTSSTTIAAQLTTYTDASGASQATKDATHIYGPYLRSIPAAPVGDSTSKGQTLIGSFTTGSLPATVTAGGYGWLYDGAGTIIPNTGALADVSSKAYNTY